MRSADEPADLTLADVQILPYDESGTTRQTRRIPSRHVVDEWSAYLGGYPVALTRNVDTARRQLLKVLSPASGEPLLLPANATHCLVETVKQSSAAPIFGGLDAALSLTHPNPIRFAWSQPVAGLPSNHEVVAEVFIVDHGDSLPLGTAFACEPSSLGADVAIFGLHLTPDSPRAGALLVFGDEELYRRWQAATAAPKPYLCQLAAHQLARIRELTMRQQAALQMISKGVESAAGLSVLNTNSGLALAHGVAVRIPNVGNPLTLWTYTKSENTPVEWMPLLRPVHYAAISFQTSVMELLQQWLFVPVGPNNALGHNQQSVLGVVKAAEYTGLRWHNDPGRAAQYAALLNAMYGCEHDGYRPAFHADETIPAHVPLDVSEVVGLACPV